VPDENGHEQYARALPENLGVLNVEHGVSYQLPAASLGLAGSQIVLILSSAAGFQPAAMWAWDSTRSMGVKTQLINQSKFFSKG
jgi:hypothetical protein